MSKAIACVTCVAALAVASIASAQVRGGAKAGLNVANQTITGLPAGTLTGNNREALLAGAFLEIPLARRVAIQPEALIDMKGAQYNYSDLAGVRTDAVLRLTSLTFPVLLHVDLRTAGRTVPYVYAGPAVGFLLSAKGHSVSNGRLRDEDVKAQFRTTEVGVTVGGGVRFGRLLAEVRYTGGLTNAFTESLGLFAKVTNRAVAVIGGIRF